MNKQPFTYGDRITYLIGWLFAAVFAILVLSNVLIGQWIHLSPCLMHAVTGYYCPGCGGTRAVLAFFHGHIIRSFFYHPVVPLFFIGYLVYMVLASIHLLTKGKTPMFHAHTRYLWIILVVTLVNWAIKNLVLLVGGIALL
ncbi:MAG: DUF2752 domain-containing protein [Eubacterium sp.]|nr:DUF2752 domain-containing protein [Eubacterium sp.]